MGLMSGDADEIVGKRVTIHFEGRKCIHSRGCVLGRPDVFVPNVDGEWIHPDAASPEQVAEIAHGCPSGAITYERTDGGPQEAPPIVNLVRVRENGPLAFHGELLIAGKPSFRATLCRCGASKNKPFCDGSHGPAAFSATGEPLTKSSKPLPRRNGQVNIEPAEDGPLLVAGSIEVVTGTGRTVDRCTKAAFCRCGASKNKPFCDGSHKAVGFRAPSGAG